MTKRTLQLTNQDGDIITLVQIDDKNFKVLGHLDHNDLFRFATKTDAMTMLSFCEAFVRRDDVLKFVKN